MKRIVLMVCVFGVLTILSACSVKKLNTEKVQDLEFTIVTEEIPKELEQMIEERKDSVFKLTYADQGNLYIAEGYGTQPTSGYSIEIKECFESFNAVYFRSNLIGPSKEERIVEEKTYPYVVILVKFTEKHVVFM